MSERTFVEHLETHARTLATGAGATASEPYKHFGDVCVRACERRLVAIAARSHPQGRETARARGALENGTGMLGAFRFHYNELFAGPSKDPAQNSLYLEEREIYASIATEARLARQERTRQEREALLSALDDQFSIVIVKCMERTGASVRFLCALDRAVQLEERAAVLETSAAALREEAAALRGVPATQA